jgi:uncharacterized membrane protein YebE (DUF533 family)
MNTTDILGGLLQAGMRGRPMGRLEHAMGGGGLGGSGGMLGQILGQLGGGAARGGAPAGTGDILGQLSGLSRSLGGGRAAAGTRAMPTSGFPAGTGMGGGTGGLGGMLGGGGGGLGGMLGGGSSGGGGMMGGNMRGAVGAGGLTLLAMLAMKALQGRCGQSAPTTPEALPEETVSEDAAALVLRAMIDAAKADGQIDGNEMQRIMGKLDEGGASAEEKDLLLTEMRKPLDPEGLAAQARTPEQAAQVYAASLLAIEVDTDAERTYLRRLAGALRLDAGTVQQLHAGLGAPAA